jgi:hypothetical protein
MMIAAIRTEGLTKGFGAGHGLFNLDLEVDEGQVLGCEHERVRRIHGVDEESSSGDVQEMEVGPPEPPGRGRLQTTASRVGQEPRW